ncbi:hypothetical protein B7495_09435 [Cryobacterium sp. LW097]|uniref:DUF3159 domain-containing protein n=1 Tax=unclassified Cryobacterium TaxID=2649013 RepID=UPI000B4DD10F|nr:MULTISPECIES: DUF3159 domain-containing protein [unclassified Cryobacterium]ASD22285.1 hypothetical protein B7495_09435 [Cryobacterium sp. LW097]TFC55559.1 DUF3159 domain-containing protein [Cryobacterium sp. TMB3-1-2]TFC72885.1 DUF3159 domain-containing protein [Cryobacterium sp. TMB3-15]TFC76391.1 DUF3159 domain-containing protein [Cryobacterium sp. TMB3-10]TFC88558.1 DUF3159 domain-containing protein [Cryobacterium sp. TMT4-31]
MTDSLSGPEPEPRKTSDGTDGTDSAARAGASSAGSPAEPAGALADSMAAAARRAGFSPAADGEPISGHALLAAMGGIRGLVEAVLPGLVFLVTYTLTRELIPSLIAPVIIGVIFFALRLARKQTVTQAVGGLVGIGLSAVLALFTGRAEDFYLPGFWTNGVYGAALLVSALIGWPLIGVAVGFLMGEQLAWRADPSKRRVLTILTFMWAGLFILRLAVQLPLYYAGNVEWLGATKLLMGIPLYAPLLVVSWLMVRSVYAATAAQRPVL